MYTTLTVLSLGFINKIVNSVNATGTKVIGGVENLDQTRSKITKVVTGSTSGIQLLYGGADVIESVSRCDYVCAFVSGVGCLSDTISLIGNYVPGANNTVVITYPVSYTCKAFVHFCRTGRLPFRLGCD
jgi:hypothetical protein